MSAELVTTSEAAEYLGVDRGTLLRWSSPHLRPEARRIEVAQKLPGRTGATLFRRSEVEALKADLEAPNTPCPRCGHLAQRSQKRVAS